MNINEQKKTISISWGVGDVKSVRGDLTDDQAWEVLCRVAQRHDSENGVNWDVIKIVAETMFPEPEDAE